jgi:hypothetical protein
MDARQGVALQQRQGRARIFNMRIDFAGVVTMVGREVYLQGKGTMHGKLLGLVTVARSRAGRRTSAN